MSYGREKSKSEREQLSLSLLLHFYHTLFIQPAHTYTKHKIMLQGSFIYTYAISGAHDWDIYHKCFCGIQNLRWYWTHQAFRVYTCTRQFQMASRWSYHAHVNNEKKRYWNIEFQLQCAMACYVISFQCCQIIQWILWWIMQYATMTKTTIIPYSCLLQKKV